MTFSAPICSPTPPSPAGYPIEPVATIVPWPGISRGTEETVPIPPGLVSEIFAPARSSGERLLVRAFSISSSKAARKPAKPRPPALRITGTIRVREPSFFSTSTAIPRLTCPSSTRKGLPSCSSKWSAITGICSVAARAIAQAMMWVKETFCPAALSSRRRASMVETTRVRKEVAVGMERLSSM